MTWLLLSAVSLAQPANRAPGATLVLVEEGRPAATIVIARDATKAAQFAACELQWHVRQITGAELPIARDDETVSGIRVLVGESAATRALGLENAAFASQEYLIRFLPDTLVLMGRDEEDRGVVQYDPTPSPEAVATWPSIWDEQGTMYAVYDFLERDCDVRWLNPTESGLDCPRRATLEVSGTEVRRKPFFRYRFAAYPSSEAYDAYTGLWPADSEGFKAWEALAYEDLHRRFPDWWGYIHAKRGWVQLFRYRMREGGEKCVGNHSLYGYYKRFWEPDPAKPEVFEGKRAEWFAQGYEGTPPQLCYTNPGLVQQVAQDARDYFDGKGINPWSLEPIRDRNEVWGENYFCVEPMDNEAFCKCPRCQEWLNREEEASPFFSNGRHSDYFFNFVNEVAKEVRKTHPDKWIVTLAYMSHAAPPKRVKLEPNVVVQFCFACNRLNYDRASYEHEIELLNQWATQEAGRPLYLWLYYTFPVEVANNGRFHCFPGFFAHAIGEQFALFRKHGLRGMFHCGYGQDVEAYVTYKLMDDPDQDVEVLLDEYFRRLYGAAAGPMKRLYLAIEETYSNPANYPEAIATRRLEGHHHQTEEVAWGYLGTERRMAEFERLLEEAKRLAATPLEKKRLELFELGTWNYMVAGRKSYMEHTKARYGGVGNALRVPFSSQGSLGGDLSRADWSEAAVLHTWRSRVGEPTKRKPEARLLNDGEHLYVRLAEETSAAALQASEDVVSGDYWDIVVGSGVGGPYRELAVGPTGRVVCREFGGDPAAGPGEWDSGAAVILGATPSGGWCANLALPLSKLLPGGAARVGRVYMNFALRSAAREDQPMVVPTFGEFHDTSCLREFVLDPPDSVPGGLPGADELHELSARDLVAFWPLDEGAGDVVTDRGPGKLQGRLVNRPTWVEDGGRQVLELDDTRRQYVDLGNAPEVNLTGPLTLLAWVKYQKSETWYPAIFGKGYEQTGTYSLHLRPGLTVWFEIDGEDGTRHFYNPTDLCLAPGVWTHVAATYDGAVMRVYINGREAGLGKEVATAIRRTAEPLRIGWLGSYGHFSGRVRDVGIWARAMSREEVFARYLAGK